jgi:hypothetical protein
MDITEHYASAAQIHVGKQLSLVLLQEAAALEDTAE